MYKFDLFIYYWQFGLIQHKFLEVSCKVYKEDKVILADICYDIEAVDCLMKSQAVLEEEV